VTEIVLTFQVNDDEDLFAKLKKWLDDETPVEIIGTPTMTILDDSNYLMFPPCSALGIKCDWMYNRESDSIRCHRCRYTMNTGGP